MHVRHRIDCLGKFLYVGAFRFVQFWIRASRVVLVSSCVFACVSSVREGLGGSAAAGSKLNLESQTALGGLRQVICVSHVVSESHGKPAA